MRGRSSRLLVIVECPLVELELREKMRCPSDSPIRCEKVEDVSAARDALGRGSFNLVILVTLGRDPAALLEALGGASEETRVIVVGESEADVTRALDAGAEMAFTRARLPSGILSHLLDVAPFAEDFVTMELPVSR